jgi:hypothetical protein
MSAMATPQCLQSGALSSCTWGAVETATVRSLQRQVYLTSKD